MSQDTMRVSSRRVRPLGFHVSRLSAAFADTREQGHLAESWFEEKAPPEMADGDSIACYGESVRRRPTEYSEKPGWCDGSVRRLLPSFRCPSSIDHSP